MNIIKEFIPVSVVVALFLFIVRELLDFFKKRQEKNREINTYKALISEEIRQNYFALKLLNKVLKVIVKFNNKNVETIHCNVHTDRYGGEYVFVDLGEGPGKRKVSMRLSTFSTDFFDAHIKDLAKLDEKLYDSVKQTYEEIRVWKTIRNDLVCYLANEIEDVRALYLNFNLRMLQQDMGANFEKLKDTHVLLTGMEIKAEAGSVVPIKKHNKTLQADPES